MKTTPYFTVAIAALSLFSCSKGQQDEPMPQMTANLKMSIATSKLTKSIEPSQSGTVSLASLTIDVMDGSGNKIATQTFDGSSNPKLADITSAGVASYTFEKIDARAASVIVYGTQGAPSYSLNGNIGDYQSFIDVPFMSTSTSITKGSSTAADGHYIWTANVDLYPTLARYEISDNFTPGDGLTSVVVTGVYMNNILLQKGNANPVLNTGNADPFGTGDWTNNTIYSTGNFKNLCDVLGANNATNPVITTGNVAAYQVFPQSAILGADPKADQAARMPHIVARVWVTPTAGNPYYGFVTIRNFKDKDGIEYISKIEQGKIYCVNFGDLTIKAADVDPDPESTAAHLVCNVTVKNWEKVTIKPEL